MERTIGQRLAPASLFQWAGQMARHPWQFFREVSTDGGYATPIYYAIFWQLMAGAIGFAVGFVPGATSLSVGGRLMWLVFGPPLTLGVGFFLSAIFFVIWHLMGSPHPFRTAFRCWALLTPLSALSAVSRLVPFLFLAVMIYGFFLLIVATVEVHGVSLKKALIVWVGVLVISLALQVAAMVFRAVRTRLMNGGEMMPGAYRQGDAPRLPGQGMLPADLQKQVEAEMAKHRAEVEKQLKESVPAKR